MASTCSSAVSPSSRASAPAASTVATGVTPSGAADGASVTYTVTGPDGSTAAPSEALGGVVGATTTLLNTTLPAYRAGLDAVATSLATSVNTQHAAGFDKSGAAGGAFFSFDPANAAATLSIAITDVADIAASSVAGGGLDGGNATAVSGELADAEGDYQRLVNVFGSEVSSVRRLAANQQVLTAQVDGSREQLSGINLDEEMVTMLQAQRAYEAAARVMSTLDSVLDTLINRTGLVR